MLHRHGSGRTVPGDPRRKGSRFEQCAGTLGDRRVWEGEESHFGQAEPRSKGPPAFHRHTLPLPTSVGPAAAAGDAAVARTGARPQSRQPRRGAPIPLTALKVPAVQVSSDPCCERSQA